MAKLCKMVKKDLNKNFDEYVSMIDKARFVCEKCGRASNKKKNHNHLFLMTMVSTLSNLYFVNSQHNYIIVDLI